MTISTNVIRYFGDDIGSEQEWEIRQDYSDHHFHEPHGNMFLSHKDMKVLLDDITDLLIEGED